MHVTSGAVGTLKLENVFEPAHPLKSYPSVIVVTFSSGETVNAMGVPCDVVPVHSPALSDGAPNDGKSEEVHAPVRTQDAIIHHAALLTEGRPSTGRRSRAFPRCGARERSRTRSPSLATQGSTPEAASSRRTP